MSQASEFRTEGQVKEFITDGGETYIVLGFPDNTPLILQKVKGKGKESASFRRVRGGDKKAYQKLGPARGTTYQQGLELLKEP